MEAVRNYFNTEGFGRWQKIYGDKDDVSKVRPSCGSGQSLQSHWLSFAYCRTCMHEADKRKQNVMVARHNNELCV